jgi:PelA/Pel-15E family pectate lyase
MHRVNRTYHHAVTSVLALAIFGFGVLLPMPSAQAQSAGCNSACTDYIRVNVQAQPLTQARVDSVAGALRSDFAAYINASNAAKNSDKASLRSERQGLSSIPKPRSSNSSGTETMPLDQSTSYYAGSTALKVAREIVSFQVPSGGWGKNMARTGTMRTRGQSYITDSIDPDSNSVDDWRYVGTIDNGATTTEIRYLAKVQAAQSSDRAALRSSIARGLNYLIAAKYPNHGWPQVYPLAGGYNDAITINDGAMLGVVQLLNEIGTGVNPDFAFIDGTLRGRALDASRKGIAWFLNHQVSINGKKTLWGQQHDALSQAPTAARAYEMPALASFESARIVDFLMMVPNPDAVQRAAVYDAVAFLKATQLNGKKYNRTSGTLDNDNSSNAWARFYDLGVYSPTASSVSQRAKALFGDRPENHGSNAYGLVFGSIASVSLERRKGYAQYNNAGQSTISRFTAWSARNPR